MISSEHENRRHSWLQGSFLSRLKRGSRGSLNSLDMLTDTVMSLPTSPTFNHSRRSSEQTTWSSDSSSVITQKKNHRRSLPTESFVSIFKRGKRGSDTSQTSFSSGYVSPPTEKPMMAPMMYPSRSLSPHLAPSFPMSKRNSMDSTTAEWMLNTSPRVTVVSDADLDIEDANVLKEIDRLPFQNDLLTLAFDGQYTCPLDLRPGMQVLDVGCGTAAWCIDVAQAYPFVSVVGIDTPAGHTVSKYIPPNCKINLYQHLLSGLQALEDKSFDLVHISFMALAYAPDFYRAVLDECWRVVKVGGYLEIMEMDLRIYGNPLAGPITQRLNNEIFDMATARSLDPRLARNLPSLTSHYNDIKQAKTNYLSFPIGTWGGRLGVRFRNDVFGIIESLQPAVAQHLATKQRSDDEWEREMDKMDEEVETFKSFMNCYNYWMLKGMDSD